MASSSTQKENEKKFIELVNDLNGKFVESSKKIKEAFNDVEAKSNQLAQEFVKAVEKSAGDFTTIIASKDENKESTNTKGTNEIMEGLFKLTLGFGSILQSYLKDQGKEEDSQASNEASNETNKQDEEPDEEDRTSDSSTQCHNDVCQL